MGFYGINVGNYSIHSAHLGMDTGFRLKSSREGPGWGLAFWDSSASAWKDSWNWWLCKCCVDYPSNLEHLNTAIVRNDISSLGSPPCQCPSAVEPPVFFVDMFFFGIDVIPTHTVLVLSRLCSKKESFCSNIAVFLYMWDDFKDFLSKNMGLTSGCETPPCNRHLKNSRAFNAAILLSFTAMTACKRITTWFKRK